MKLTDHEETKCVVELRGVVSVCISNPERRSQYRGVTRIEQGFGVTRQFWASSAQGASIDAYQKRCRQCKRTRYQRRAPTGLR